jgi:hypothetical protein
MIMAQLQGQDTARYASALRACNIALDRIPADITDKTLKSLPSYCQKHGLAFGLAHTLGDEADHPEGMSAGAGTEGA